MSKKHGICNICGQKDWLQYYYKYYNKNGKMYCEWVDCCKQCEKIIDSGFGIAFRLTGGLGINGAIDVIS